MGPVLVFLALAATGPDLAALARAGATPETIAAAWLDSGGGSLDVSQAVTLYGEGVPAAALALLLDDDGDGEPRLRGLGLRLEIAYRDFRIIGTPSASGPNLVVSGFDDKGERLKPPTITGPLAPPDTAPVPLAATAEAPDTATVEALPPSPESFTERQPEVHTAMGFYEPFYASSIVVFVPSLPPEPPPRPADRPTRTAVDHVGTRVPMTYNAFGDAPFDLMFRRR